MLDHTGMELLKTIAEDIVLFGGAVMAILYGLKRVYGVARNVEKLVEKSEATEKSNNEYRLQLKEDLESQTKSRDEKLENLTNNLDMLSSSLNEHIKVEEARDYARDTQLIKITEYVDEMVKEMRPNGGSSMKDILNKASQKVDEVHTRVAVLEQWKDDNVPPSKRKIARRKATRRK
jgi:hypothetical protein